MALSNAQIGIIVAISVTVVIAIILAIIIIASYSRYKKDRKKATVSALEYDLINTEAEKAAKRTTKKIVIVREKRPYVVGYGKKTDEKRVIEKAKDDSNVVS